MREFNAYSQCLPFNKVIHRSQRDVKGEREARIREIEEVEEKLRRVEGEIATADAEKAQFLAASKRKDAEFNAHRFVIIILT